MSLHWPILRVVATRVMPYPLAVRLKAPTKQGGNLSDQRLPNRQNRLQAMSSEILDIQGAATLLGVSPRTVYRLAARSQLPGVKIGKEWRFSRKRLIGWVAQGGHSRNETDEQTLESLLRSGKVRPLRQG